MCFKMRTLSFLAALSLLWAAGAGAQRFASQKRGLGAATAFAVSEIDHVNLFNTNLILTVPLGPSYPVGPNLSYQATLAYNGNSWDSEQIHCPGPYYQPIPSKTTNAGHGWVANFGLLIPPDDLADRWRYVSMDGNQHSFYYRLHPGYPATTVTTVQFTNDGSYLRMRYSATDTLCESDATPAGSECRLVEFPNGNVAEFRNFASGADDYRLVLMRDPFGNSFSVAYAATTWTLTDSHDRVQTLTFADTTPPYQRLESLSLTSFGGGTATYDLQYDENQTISRQNFNEAICTSSPTVAVDMLDRIVLPDGSYYELDYYRTDDYDPGASENDVLSGGVKSLRLPTGGKYTWTYTPLSFASQEPERPDPPGPGEKPSVNVAYGVATKSVYENASDTTPLGTWTYVSRENLSYKTPNDDRVACHSETTVTDPLGNDTVHYFATSYSDHRWTYGLPLTYCNPSNGGYSATGPYLSMEVYDGNRSAGTKLRSVYVEYGSDGGNIAGGVANQEKNHRLRYRKTVYHDDNDRYKDVTFSDFDGLGNFRSRAEGGDFTVSQDSRSVYVDYNAAYGELIVNPETGNTAGSTFVMPGTNDTWLFGTYTKQEVTAAGETAKSEYCFDATGFLTRRRVLAGTSRSDADLLTWFFPGNAASGGLGHVRRELSYGGDTNVSGGGGLEAAGLGPVAFNDGYGVLCDMTLPAQSEAQYQIERTYASGVLKTEDAVDLCSGESLLSRVDVDVDASTGLVAASRDSAGVQTDFTYDAQGRLTSEQAAEGAWLSYAYQLPTVDDSTLVPKLTVTNCVHGNASCSAANALTWEQILFDGLGRKETEKIRIPATGGIVIREKKTTYNALGWKLTESVWGDTSLKTTYSNFDRFGRVGKIQPPGGNEPTEFTYKGERLKTRESRVRLEAGMSSAFTTEYYNNRGKLVLLCEKQATDWSGACDSSELQTNYTYDVGDRVQLVCLNKSGSSCGQTRQFLYDHRGFLTAEKHPEVGPSGNGWTYYEYDSRGNVTLKDVGLSTEFDLWYDYDRAGRLTEVREVNQGEYRLLKQYFYGYDNTVTDLRKGKLVQTVRTNWVDPVGPLFELNPGALKATIAETFKYEGLEGRVSSRQTRFKFGNLGLAFDFSQTYDALGNVASVTYPQCVHGQGDCLTAAPARTVSYTYEKGFLRSVPGYATQLSYQGGGMLHQIEHANGVTYTVDINSADGLERPYQISTTAGWDTGVYQYDGMGNIHQIGNQEYRYDRLSRLTRGEVEADGVEREQSVSYDDYGNITSLTTAGSTLTTTTSASTNRLTGLSASYDAGGNLTGITYPNGERYQYTYDSSNVMKHLQSNRDVARVYLYNADDERLAQFDCPNNSCADSETSETWTIRNLEGQILRSYIRSGAYGWTWAEDQIYRQAHVLAIERPDNSFYLHTDHLLTPLQTSNQSGLGVSASAYYPFGGEAASGSQDPLSIGLAGAEKDGFGAGLTQSLDYLHARFNSSPIGRFASADPVGRTTTFATAYNRYSFNLDNPVNFVDRDGRFPFLFLSLFSAYKLFTDSITVTDNFEQSQGADFEFGLNSLRSGRLLLNSLTTFLGRDLEGEDSLSLFGVGCDDLINPTFGAALNGGAFFGGGASLTFVPTNRIELTLYGGLGGGGGLSAFGGLGAGKSKGWGLTGGVVGGMPVGINGVIEGTLAEPAPAAFLGLGVGAGEGAAGGISYTFVLYDACK